MFFPFEIDDQIGIEYFIGYPCCGKIFIEIIWFYKFFYFFFCFYFSFTHFQLHNKAIMEASIQGECAFSIWCIISLSLSPSHTFLLCQCYFRLSVLWNLIKMRIFNWLQLFAIMNHSINNNNSCLIQYKKIKRKKNQKTHKISLPEENHFMLFFPFSLIFQGSYFWY